MRYSYTIGMAGHIDHGKTALTKALTGIETDHLKEEKERKISIEPGFAPFLQEENIEVSIIDVPGHERFIRQMIAGVAGIDMVILVISADEGIMPQTREHVEILSLLGIKKGLIVLTKVDQAEEELLEIIVDDVKEEFKDTFLQSAPIYFVDSLSGTGIPCLKRNLKKYLGNLPPKTIAKPFRLPIDHVFTVKGQGVVVRGTVSDGIVKEGDLLYLYPKKKEVRARQIQRHKEQKSSAVTGQRAAINISGVPYQNMKRGDVLVADDFFPISNRIDISLKTVKQFTYPLKQRQWIKLHIGTSEVMGRIVFFDRNQLLPHTDEEILCQLQLEESIVVTRGDRFIIRRPTPAETIGGGWVIEPQGEHYKFHEKTIEYLKRKKDGTLTDRAFLLLENKTALSAEEIKKDLAISREQFAELKPNLISFSDELFTSEEVFKRLKKRTLKELKDYHDRYPMRIGIDKAELISNLQQKPSLIDYFLERLSDEDKIRMVNQYVALNSFEPTLPKDLKTDFESIYQQLLKHGAEVEKWHEYFVGKEIPENLQQDFYHYLLETEKVFVLDNERLIAKEVVSHLYQNLKREISTKEFTLQDARKVLHLSRKNLIPLLELFDQLGFTKRIKNKRIWL